jgi:hypothetical protein
MLRVAVLHQNVPPPLVNGTRKPVKPNAYRDSSSDIAFALHASGVDVVAPHGVPSSLSPDDDTVWSFGDDAIDAALAKGATCLWANTVLFKAHPLAALLPKHPTLRIVGQPLALAEALDDKQLTNHFLFSRGVAALPSLRFCPASPDDWAPVSKMLPVVLKPVRGRGSEGVVRCDTLADAMAHYDSLRFATYADGTPRYGSAVIAEPFLNGREFTVTVMPTSDGYKALPPVERVGHVGGVAPYTADVPAVANSRVLGGGEIVGEVAALARECERCAALLRPTAPIRIDARGDGGGVIRIFDVNAKPNLTGGPRSCAAAASLVEMAALAAGWDYCGFLTEVLKTCATDLREIATRPAPF